MQISNGGTIKGKVTYTGEVPVRKIIPTKDQQVCGGIREVPQVLVGANNGGGGRGVPEGGPERGSGGQAEKDIHPQ
jgi:hypothetical protein